MAGPFIKSLLLSYPTCKTDASERNFTVRLVSHVGPNIGPNATLPMGLESGVTIRTKSILLVHTLVG